MPKKKVKAEFIDPPITHEAVETKATHFMSVAESAATSLQGYLNILHSVGFFRTGEKITLATKPDAQLFVSEKGELMVTRKPVYDISYPLELQQEFLQPEAIGVIPAVIEFDLRTCGEKIMTKLDSLLPRVESNDRHLKKDLETITMRVEQIKRLNAKQ